MYFPKFFLLLLTACALLLASCASDNEGRQVAIAFYNCENFFDPADNPAKDDDEFTPQGKYHYTQKIYEQKLHNIATVLQTMNSGAGPAIIGLAEIENNTVLTDLVQQPEIARRNYKYEWYDGPDPRGINVALVYDPARFVMLRSEALSVDLSGIEGKSHTRDVLYVYGILNGDTVHVFVNHWPSRKGGEGETDAKRVMAARVNRNTIDGIVKNDPNAKVIVMGDFNDNPGDVSMATRLGAMAEQTAVAVADLYNPWASLYKSGQGTECFGGKWNLFDQVLISGSLLKNANHKLQYEKAEIFRPDFITDHYKGHDGEPHRSYAGTHWINGYSDHFPVILYLTYSKPGN